MTSNGRRIAFLIGIVIAFMLPKKVECGYSGATGCGTFIDGRRCTPYDIEPWGFSLIEHLAGTNVGFAYSSGEDCR